MVLIVVDLDKYNYEEEMERKVTSYMYEWWEMNSDSDDPEFFAKQGNLWELYIRSFQKVNNEYVREMDPEGWLRLDCLLGFMMGAADGESWEEFMRYVSAFNYLWEKHVKPCLFP